MKDLEKLLKNTPPNQKIATIIENFGDGFDLIYLDGKEEGFDKGQSSKEIEIVENMICLNYDFKEISKITNLSITKIKQIAGKS